MAQSWLVLSIATLLIWGVWGLFANLTARHLGGFSALVWEVLGAMIVGGIIFVWLIRHDGLETPVRGAIYGLATGITYTIGLTFLFFALTRAGSSSTESSSVGNVHTVLVLTALYPIVAVVLNYFILSEPLSLRQVIGMVIGVTGITILVTGQSS